MTDKHTTMKPQAQTQAQSISAKISHWAADPMRSVVAATASVVAAFALVLSGMGMINLAV